jgi:hypothetical protein
MDPTMLANAGLGLSVVAVLFAVAALLRTGSIAKAVAQISSPAPGREKSDSFGRDQSARIGEMDEQFNVMARQLDALQLSMSELSLAQQHALEARASASTAPPSLVFEPEPEPVFEPVTPPALETALPSSPVTISVAAKVQPDLPSDAPRRDTEDLIDALVAGYRAKIAERSKAPIREWLSQNNSITLDATEDGSLIASESGVIAAIMIGDGLAILVPTASFVVDFATRFAGSQISLRQVMRNTFEAVVDNSGDMKLQVPGLARREGERWIVEKPGRLGGFTDI